MQISSKMRACLRAAARDPLRRQRHGWANTGCIRGFQCGTVEARITKAGRAVLNDGGRA